MKCLNAEADCKYQLKVQMLDSSEMDYEITVIWLAKWLLWNAKLILFTSFFFECFIGSFVSEPFRISNNLIACLRLYLQIALFSTRYALWRFFIFTFTPLPVSKIVCGSSILVLFLRRFYQPSKGWNKNSGPARFGLQTTRSKRKHLLRTVHTAERWSKELADQ